MKTSPRTSSVFLSLVLCVVLMCLSPGCATTAAPASAPASKVSGDRGPVRSDYRAGEVARLCQDAIERLLQRVNAVAALRPDQRTIASTMLEFEDSLADFADETNGLTFMGYVSTNEAIRNEGVDCEEKIGQLFVDLYTRRDLYEALKNVKGRSADERRLLSETVRAFEKNGLRLADADLAELKVLLKELSTKETKFTANLNNDQTTVLFAKDDLEGVPMDAVKRFQRDKNGNYLVTTKSTDYLAVAENAVKPETRRRMMLAYLNRGTAENTRLLEEATQLRAKIARRLGYPTWVDYRTSDQMAKSRAVVVGFLNSLKLKLAERNRADFEKLMAFKREVDPAAKTLEPWDVPYLSYQLKKRDYALDNERIREFFPAEVVVDGMFEVYSRILGVKFKSVPAAAVWSSDVKLYEILDSANGRRIAYFYADFFPRPGKYGHAAAFTLISGRDLGGRYAEPVSAIVANFTPPGNDKPSLLTHEEVETIFHEFGHIMHQTLTRAPYSSLSGTSTARDFVEAPSQMLENWVWSSEILPIISGHYKDPSKKLPPDLLERMLLAKDFGQGMYYTKQLLYGIFDVAIHSGDGRIDVTKAYDDLYREIIGEKPMPGGHFAQTFGHMMGGYDAGYYGYLWSEVYAQDMFSLFEKKGLLSSELGARYRASILEPGDMREPMVLLKRFLGRPPRTDAFFKKVIGPHKK